ncbi:MAG: orotidine 5'-phosphate decarboxylase [Bradymonadales bacterium]|nr:orotidine 5'-phosphate decarboxylase [Bradymonadales bacterium]
MKVNTQLVAALDTLEIDRAMKLVEAVAEIDFMYGFKVGFALGLRHGLGQVVQAIRTVTPKPVIYDHQKAATDIPDTGELFADVLATAGIDEGILFPQAGPLTLRSWVEALRDRRIEVIVGGLMTHPSYLVSQGGFLSDEAVTAIYRVAHDLGVRRFVIPLTKPEMLSKLVSRVSFDPTCVFYSPGYGRQGGGVSAFDFVREQKIIVGRSLLEASDPRAVVAGIERAATEVDPVRDRRGS